MILLNFALECTVCREEFADFLADPAQALFLVCGVSVPRISEGVCNRGGRGVWVVLKRCTGDDDRPFIVLTETPF